MRDFNTTLVSVLDKHKKPIVNITTDFNTTLVSVLVVPITKSYKELGLFQYNTCVGSRLLLVLELFKISVFQYNTCVGSSIICFKSFKALAKISIQHLCRF